MYIIYYLIFVFHESDVMIDWEVTRVGRFGVSQYKQYATRRSSYKQYATRKNLPVVCDDISYSVSA